MHKYSIEHWDLKSTEQRVIGSQKMGKKMIGPEGWWYNWEQETCRVYLAGQAQREKFKPKEHFFKVLYKPVFDMGWL